MSYRERYLQSNALLQKALRITPGGAQTRSRMAQQFVQWAYPAFLVNAEGARVQDLDGHWYTDFIMGLGAVGVGYGAFKITADAPTLSLPHPNEYLYAEALLNALGWPDMVRFVKTGSEATEGAMRIARVATGRSHILSIGYHGWHSVHDAAASPHPGVPDYMAETITNVPYNDITSLVKEMGPDVAAVIMEPVLHTKPVDGYLHDVRRLCDNNGAVLIFDEVVAGFRWAIGGGGQYFGVTPDLATFGKAMSNGWPLGAIVGRRDLMEAGGKFVSSTFGGETSALAAGMLTLGTYIVDGVVQQIHEAGTDFKHGLTDIFPFEVRGYPCKPYIVATLQDEEQRNLAMSLLIQEAAAEGVLLHPTSLNVSAAHKGEIETVIANLTHSADRINRWYMAGDMRQRLQGERIRPLFKRTGPPA